MKCELAGAYEYCREQRGTCCRVCRKRRACLKACRNDPERCGWAEGRDGKKQMMTGPEH